MAAASNLPATIGSRYLPVRLIGKGGMGLVYEVVHAHTGEHLALKVLQGSAGAPAEALERFKREARAPAQIKSDNVVHVSDADVAPELDDAPFLVMELLEGIDLERAASQAKPDAATVVGWLRQIAPALDKAHRLGIIHRDLKPENLFLAAAEGRPPVVKILDFGIAKMAEEGSAATISGQVLGTPKYMAPEQAGRHRQVTPATDLYALGLIAYRLLVGESYHRGAVMSILAEVMHGAAIPPSARDPSLGPAFDAWFLQACHRDPDRRFASASQQIEALAEALGLPASAGDTSHEQPSHLRAGLDAAPAFSVTTTTPRAQPSVQNRRPVIAIGLLLLVVAIAALSYRGSRAFRTDGSATHQMPARPPADPGRSPVELSPFEPRPAHQLRAAATAGPAASGGTSEAATAPPEPSPPAHPRSPGAAARSKPVSGRVAAPIPQPGKVVEAPPVPVRDPFRDQK
jgi:serine/threonine protein kinase